LRHLREADLAKSLAKSAGRCAIATLSNQHESGTFCPCAGKADALAAEIAGINGR
jgi:hypothetical protein